MQLVTQRSKRRLQNFCQSTEHCFIAFDDVSSCERIRGGIGWLAVGRNSSFPWILCMCHDWCGFCRQIYYLSWVAVKTSCRFSGIPVELIHYADAVDYVIKPGLSLSIPFFAKQNSKGSWKSVSAWVTGASPPINSFMFIFSESFKHAWMFPWIDSLNFLQCLDTFAMKILSPKIRINKIFS